MVRDEEFLRSLMESAQSLIAEGGLKALSFRSLASHSGHGIGRLTYRFKNKEDLIEEILLFSLRDHLSNLECFLSDSAAMMTNESQSLAAVVSLYLDDLHLNRRQQCITWMELVSDFSLRRESSHILERSNSEMQGLWQAFLAQAGFDDCRYLSALISDYVTAEIPYSLAIGGDAKYRRLRTAVVRRLTEGILKTERSQDIQPLIKAMMPIAEVSPIRRGVGRPASFADAAASIIVSEGIVAVTHRAVAVASKAPLSTVVHHFPTVDDLVQAGLESMLEHQLRDLSQQPEQPTADSKVHIDHQLVESMYRYHQAAFQLILAASRRPHLQPAISALRGQRGQRTAKLHSRHMLTDGWDVGAVHVLSFVMSGNIFWNMCNDPVAEAGPLIDEIIAFSQRMNPKDRG